ncbi:hypothetical protein CPZ20_06640 [Lacticaseibacillus rhamnosus]|nr:hypothetical protein CPZ20_06640 [Lacticaseibacillus rhamnosus]PCL37512.1 hypothetical protein CPZ19_04840 [Lacticaseibacillus rhamnosus]PCL39876.1 hypothetical protein CPZ11_06875 [Lacticaseibacillus rhamnosus]PCL42837.1 hypothetical protein CPZ10_06955 [Lacticaseibacillus rhamnosus]
MCFDGETGCFVAMENAFTITCFMAQKAGCMDHGAMVKRRLSRSRPLMLRFLSAPVHAHKRVHQPRNLHIRTLSAMTKTRSSRSRPLMLRFLTGLAHALFWTKCLRFL